MKTRNSENIKKSKRCEWTKNKELALINLWAENATQFEHKRLNKQAYNQIYIAMKQKGFRFELSDIYNKIHNLRRKYRSELAKNTQSTWSYFSRIAEIQGSADSEQDEENDCVIDDNLPTSFSSVYVTEHSPLMYNVGENSNGEDIDGLRATPRSCEVVIPTDNVDKRNSIFTKQNFTPIYNDYELFGQLVACELTHLDDELLVETKRNIFNIICDANIKQQNNSVKQQ